MYLSFSDEKNASLSIGYFPEFYTENVFTVAIYKEIIQ